MKTTILHLDPHDDIISVRDKMGWSQTGRLLLVWPRRGRVLTRRLDLVMLQRQSEQMGLQLALVTRDRNVRYHAVRLGIPVFWNLRRAQSKPWRVNRWFRREAARAKERLQEAEQPRQIPERPARPKPLPPLVRLLVFSLGVLAMLSIAAVLLPSAEMALTPEVREQTVILQVAAQPGLSETGPGKVPVVTRQVIVEGRDQLPVSGTVQVPDQPAAGRVRFTNLTDQAVRIPSGTVVKTPGQASIRFYTTMAGDVPPGTGQSISLPLKAESGGRTGNLQPDQLTVIEGPLGLSLTATNPDNTTGGTERTGPAPSEQDRQELSERLESTLQQTAMTELQNSLDPNDQILSAEPELVEILETEYRPDNPAPADFLTLSLRLQYEVQAVSGADLEELALRELEKSIPPGFYPLAGSLEIETTRQPQMDASGAARLEVRARRSVTANVSELKAVRMALGLSPEQARQRLAAGLSLEQAPVIALKPDWWPRLPVLPFRIQVTGTASPESLK